MTRYLGLFVLYLLTRINFLAQLRQACLEQQEVRTPFCNTIETSSIKNSYRSLKISKTPYANNMLLYFCTIVSVSSTNHCTRQVISLLLGTSMLIHTCAIFLHISQWRGEVGGGGLCLSNFNLKQYHLVLYKINGT